VADLCAIYSATETLFLHHKCQKATSALIIYVNYLSYLRTCSLAILLLNDESDVKDVQILTIPIPIRLCSVINISWPQIKCRTLLKSKLMVALLAEEEEYGACHVAVYFFSRNSSQSKHFRLP